MDGAQVVTFYVSGDPFVPGDALLHDFQVRAVNGDCYSVSNVEQGTDQPPQKPGEIAPGLTPETAQSLDRNDYPNLAGGLILFFRIPPLQGNDGRPAASS